MKACEPSWFLRLVNLPDLNWLDGGQVLIGALPCGLLIHSRSERSACIEEKLGWWFTPIIRNPWVWPSFG